MLHERHFAIAVARVHRADLRHGGMRLVDEQQVVVGKEIEQRVGRASRRPARERLAVVLDPRAVTHLEHHLAIVAGPRAEPLGLQMLALRLEQLQPPAELLANLVDRPLDPRLGQHEVLRRIDEHPLELVDRLARRRIDDREPLDLVAPELDPVGELLVARPDLDRIAPHAELAPRGIGVVPLVLNVDQLPQQRVAIDDLAHLEPDHHRLVILRRTQAIDARHARHDDHVPPADQGTRRRQPHPVDLFVDRGILLDVDVPLRDVRLGLVIVVVADEVAHRVVRKEFLEFAIELGRERLVVRQHQRRTLHLLNDVRHRKGLARARDTHQHLLAPPTAQALDQLLDRLGLIPGGFKRCL